MNNDPLLQLLTAMDKDLLIQKALECRALGLVPIPTSDKKRAVAKWKSYYDNRPSEWETLQTFNFSFTAGIALLCGPISNNLEVIDIDTKNDLDGNIMSRLYDLIEKTSPELAAKLVIQQTRSGGYHLLYYSDKVERSQPLAQRPCTEEELNVNPDQKIKILIETRGTKGMACISPSAGYHFIRGNLHTIPQITETERSILLHAARSFKEKEKVKHTRLYLQKDIDPATSPIDDFNRRGDIVHVLEKHGWIIFDEEPERTVFRRPGDTDKESSGNFNYTLNLFSTFSTSTQFIPQKGYTKAHVFIMLECAGDNSAGAKELLRLGYGIPRRQLREEQRKKMGI